MIKLKDILFEGKPPSIFIPRRMEDRIERMIKSYIRNGSKGNLDLGEFGLTELPSILKDIDVGRFFICSNNNLTSLNNSPKTVGRYFSCNNNKLTSLEGAPSSVGGGFSCSNNLLTSLTGAPKTVGGSFHCGNNQLISLKGAPSSVGGGFICSNNNLTSLIGAPTYVGGSFSCGNNSVQFTEAQVRAVCDVKGKIFV